MNFLSARMKPRTRSAHSSPVSSLFALTTPLFPREFGASVAHPDRPLVLRAQGGDARAFRALYERYGKPVWRFAQDSLRDPVEADEVTQETFVRAHAALARLHDPDRFLPWLLGVARRICLERHRRSGIQPAGSAEEVEAHAPLQPSAPTPEELLLDVETEAQLDAALSLLGESRRTALLLRIDHGLAYDEIATVMNWSIPKVKNELHRARLQLRAQLAPHVGRTA